MNTFRDPLRRTSWLAAALAGAAAVAAPGGALPLPLTAFALAIAWGVLPGAWLARRLAGDQRRDVRAAFALLASPFLCGAALALARTAGVQPTLAAQAISAVLALLAAGEALRPAVPDEESGETRAGWWAALGIGAVLLLAHAIQPALTLRSDGAFHAGVVHAVERALPPEDPFFAGLRLHYAWGLHAWAAGWLALSPRLEACTPLVWANAGAAVSALLAVAAIARRFGANPRTTLVAQLLALIGASPFGWLGLAARATGGEVRGGAELSQALDHGADVAFRALDPGWLHPSLVLPLDKFVVLTPFAFALAGAAVAVLLMAAWYDARSPRALACLVVALAAAIHAHPFGGVAVFASLFAGSLTVALVGGGPRSVIGPVLALLVSIAPLVPYLLSLAGPYERFGSGAPLPDLRVKAVLSALAGGAIVLPMAARTLFGAVRRDLFAVFAFTVGCTLVIFACTFLVEGENQSKFLNLAFLLAAAPAAVGWARLAPAWRSAAAIAFALAVGPTLAAALWAYAHETPMSQDAPSRPPQAILAAIEAQVPRDGILVDASQDSTRGAAPALPGATGRALLWSGGFMARKGGHTRHEFLERADLAAAITRGETAGVAVPEGIAHRELWLLVPETAARAADPRVVARADSLRLIRFLR